MFALLCGVFKMEYHFQTAAVFVT